MTSTRQLVYVIDWEKYNGLRLMAIMQGDQPPDPLPLPRSICNASERVLNANVAMIDWLTEHGVAFAECTRRQVRNRMICEPSRQRAMEGVA
jgi:hypothetical protein